MAALGNSSPDARRLSIPSSRKHSTSSSEDGWQGMVAPSTPATSVNSEDFEADQERHSKMSDLAARTRHSHKETVIHEEAECAPDPSGARDEEHLEARENHNKCTPADEMDSPTLPASPEPLRVLQPVEYDLPYTHPDMPWDKFYSSRANYPRSMFDTALNYHRGPLDVLHDLGAGSGLAADGLLNAISARQGQDKILPRTILSDPGQENLGIATRFLAARQPGVQLECLQARGEDQDNFLISSGIDMTFCAEALHWMDVPVAVGQTARSLRPGGTFAVVLYSCFPRILNNGRAKKALRTLVEDHLRHRLLSDPDKDDKERERSPNSPTFARVHPNWERGMKSLAYGLDAVELPADQWEDIKRFEINCGATGWWWPCACKDMLGCAMPMADVSPHERYVYEDYQDWGRWASVSELKDLLMSIQVGFGDKTWEGSLWKELEGLVRGPLHLVWQVHMILARKKSPGLETVSEESSSGIREVG